MTRAEIKSAALELEPAEREALAEELLLSLSAGDSQVLDAECLAEARRRDADLAAGKTYTVPLQDVLDGLRAKVKP